ncbi:hypothetical protein PENSPDRAFT_692963 [Peniophora sp. CONT]|nr:hypothetical protein PENSPDRAFT_692963 [Peniophora sp. CONT]
MPDSFDLHVATRTNEAPVTQVGSRLPVMGVGDPSIGGAVAWYEGTELVLVTSPKIEPKSYVLMVLGCFRDERIRSWISANRPRLVELTLADFFRRFCDAWLPNRWLMTLRGDILNASHRGRGPWGDHAAKIWSAANTVSTSNSPASISWFNDTQRYALWVLFKIRESVAGLAARRYARAWQLAARMVCASLSHSFRARGDTSSACLM